MNPLRITVLADNTVTGRQVRGEHGLCFHIAAGKRRLLFDTGQGLVLAENAKALGIDLSEVDTVALSHGHYDHTGGLPLVLDRVRQPVTVCTHPAALEEKYHDSGPKTRFIGMPLATRNSLSQLCGSFELTREPAEIAPGIHCTGEIPRAHPEEASVEEFYLDPDGHHPDPLLDDQSLFLDTPQGTVVLLGCAHAGVINILDYIQQLTGGQPIRAVLGGMHLGSATPERMDWVLAQLDRIAPQQLMPMHCTGIRAIAALWNRFPQSCRPCGTGSVFTFSTTKESP